MSERFARIVVLSGAIFDASVVTGTIFAFLAVVATAAADTQCTQVGAEPCTAEGLALRKTESQRSWLSGVTFGVGVLALAVGLLLAFSPPRAAASSGLRWLYVRPAVGRQTATLSLGGSF